MLPSLSIQRKLFILALGCVLAGALVAAPGVQRIIHYESARSDAPGNFVGGLSLARNRTESVSQFDIVVARLHPIRISISGDIPYPNATGNLYIWLALPFWRGGVNVGPSGSDYVWHTITDWPFGSLSYASIPVAACMKQECAFRLQLSIQAEDSALGESRGRYSILLPFGYPIREEMLSLLPHELQSVGVTPMKDSFTVRIPVDHPATDIQVFLSSLPVQVVAAPPSNIWRGGQRAEFVCTTTEPQTIVVQFSVLSEIETYENDLIWGPTLVLTGLGSIFSFSYQAARQLIEERHKISEEKRREHISTVCSTP